MKARTMRKSSTAQRMEIKDRKVSRRGTLAKKPSRGSGGSGDPTMPLPPKTVEIFFDDDVFADDYKVAVGDTLKFTHSTEGSNDQTVHILTADGTAHADGLLGMANRQVPVAKHSSVFKTPVGGPKGTKYLLSLKPPPVTPPPERDGNPNGGPVVPIIVDN